MYVCWVISVMSDSATLQTIAWEAPLSMEPQEGILGWVALPSSRRSSWHKDWTQVSYIFCIVCVCVYKCIYTKDAENAFY